MAISGVLFEDRHDGGRKLAAELGAYRGKRVVVLAIPNGGVPVGLELAEVLGAELGVVVCRKIPIPLAPEGGLGAVAEDGAVYLNEAAVKRIGLTEEQIDYEASKVRVEIKKRSLLYQADRLPVRVNDRVVIIVDDGLASGITMTAAVESVRGRRAREIVVAAPVASAIAVKQLERVADKVVTCATINQPKFYVADYYRHWFDLGDDEVVRYLERWRGRHKPQFRVAG
ncbi:MAG: phosphoribosyltransferase family protein [Chloroflexota bacterium]